jgi:hypothetical protein
MPPRAENCPHCGRKVEANEEFCIACGAWLYGGPAWPPPPRTTPLPPPPMRESDPNDEPVPLQLPPSPSGTGATVARVAIALATAISAVAWTYAERMIVNDDDRLNWDIAWIVAATITVLLGLWLLMDAVRRGRALGWDHSWRVWESPHG